MQRLRLMLNCFRWNLSQILDRVINVDKLWITYEGTGELRVCFAIIVFHDVALRHGVVPDSMLNIGMST